MQVTRAPSQIVQRVLESSSLEIVKNHLRILESFMDLLESASLAKKKSLDVVTGQSDVP